MKHPGQKLLAALLVAGLAVYLVISFKPRDRLLGIYACDARLNNAWMHDAGLYVVLSGKNHYDLTVFSPDGRTHSVARGEWTVRNEHLFLTPQKEQNIVKGQLRQCRVAMNHGASTLVFDASLAPPPEDIYGGLQNFWQKQLFFHKVTFDWVAQRENINLNSKLPTF